MPPSRGPDKSFPVSGAVPASRGTGGGGRREPGSIWGNRVGPERRPRPLLRQRVQASSACGPGGGPRRRAWPASCGSAFRARPIRAAASHMTGEAGGRVPSLRSFSGGQFECPDRSAGPANRRGRAYARGARGRPAGGRRTGVAEGKSEVFPLRHGRHGKGAETRITVTSGNAMRSPAEDRHRPGYGRNLKRLVGMLQR